MIPLTATTDWVSAVGGIVTTLIALYLLYQGQRDRARTRKTERRDQASRVSVTKPVWGGQRTAGGDLLQPTVTVRVVNRSEDAVSSVFVSLRYDDHDIFASTPSRKELKRVGQLDALSGEDVIFTLLGKVPQGQLLPGARVELFFTDAAGRDWLRDSSHVLRELVDRKKLQKLRGEKANTELG